MEQSTVYEKKVDSLMQAIKSFKNALDIDLSGFGGIEIDTIKSGQVQKFEVCVELLWKTIRKFLYDVHGIESISPKMTMKHLYNSNYADETAYEMLLEMINDRNRLSHVYDEAQFSEIYLKLPEYYILIKSIMGKIRQ